MRYLIIFFALLISSELISQPANNNCTGATALTINGALTCNQLTNGANSQTGECLANWAGGSNATVWYSFNATNDSLVLNMLLTSGTSPILRVYGPFASLAGGCLPTCAQAIYNAQLAGDPGNYILLTNLTTTSGNNTYIVQVDGIDPNGPSNPIDQFCIGVSNPSNSTFPTSGTIINSCGTTFNGTSQGGYFPTGTSAGFNNLDGNNATTAAGAAAGDDVTFIMNNPSWFSFCTTTAGTYGVQFDVLSCIFSGANSGAQMAIFTGSPTSLTSIGEAPNPTQPATAVWTFPTFSLSAGGCAYLVVDGFAGDACSYSYVLSNFTGGCNLVLPLELLSITATPDLNQNLVRINWATATQVNGDYFILERSEDGVKFITIKNIPAFPQSSNVMFYSGVDENPVFGSSYYRIVQVDHDGSKKYSNIVAVEFENKKDLNFEIIPNPISSGANSYIKLNSNIDASTSISIRDLNGVVVFENKLNGTNQILIPANLNQGIYFVSLFDEKRVSTKRLLIRE